jgi:CBS domain-containing protein
MSTLPGSRSHLMLRSITAAELMTANPVSIRSNATLREAILLLHDRNIDAAPVINEAGHAVGVISRSDLLTHERETAVHDGPAPECDTRRELRPTNGASSGNASRCDHSDVTRVCDIMTGAVFSVSPDTPANSVVEQLLALNVHRLFVVSEDGILAGVITTTDVLRHLMA